MKRLGELLIEWGILSKEQLVEVLREQMRTGKLLGEIVQEMGFARDEDIERALTTIGGIPSISLNSIIVDVSLLKTIPESFLKSNLLLPLWQTHDEIFIASPTPRDLPLRDRVQSLTQKKPIFYYASEEEIREFLSIFLGAREKPGWQPGWVLEKAGKESSASEAVPLFHQLCSSALNQNATDLYLEPAGTYIRVRIRSIGKLTEDKPLEWQEYQLLRKVFRTFFQLSTDGNFERGRKLIRYKNSEYQLKATTTPTTKGEMWHIGFSETSSFPLRLEYLNMRPEAQSMILDSLQLPGVAFVVGPSGSEKTHTLYTLLLEATSPERNVITIEKPLEFHFPQINQISLTPEQEVLPVMQIVSSQHIDILLISEISTKEEILEALRMGEEGTTVLTGFPALNCIDALLRVHSIGVSFFSFIGSTRFILAQRLIRKICPHCKETVEVSEQYGEIFGSTDTPLWLFAGKGCEICNFSGYLGKTHLFEFLPFTPELKSFLMSNPSPEEIQKRIPSFQLYSLMDDGREKAQTGITTMAEVLRVIH